MLHGTFDIFPLTDLVAMLVAAHRTGSIEICTDLANGSIHLQDGLCVGVEPSASPDVSEASLASSLVDVCVRFGKDPEASFKFVVSTPPPSAVAIDVASSIAEIDRITAESDAVNGLVGSLDSCPEVAPEIASESITLSATQWALLANVDGRTAVRDLKRPQETSLIEVCKEIADLVERGALRLGTDSPPHTPQRSSLLASAHVTAPVATVHQPLALVAPYSPGVDEQPDTSAARPSDADVVDDSGSDAFDYQDDQEDTDVSTVADRSVMLKMFSALRDA